MDTPAFLQLRQAAPWIGLLIVLSTITYGLNLFATAIAPTGSAVSVGLTTIDHVQDNAALLESAVLEPSPLASHVASRSPGRVVTITGRDAVTGERIQIQCAVVANRVGSDTLLVDLKDFSGAVSGACGNSP